MAAPNLSSLDNALLTAAETELRAMLTEGTVGARTMAAPMAGVSLPDVMINMFLMQMASEFRSTATLTGVQLPSFTVGTVPTASSNTGRMIFVTDETGGAVPAFSDGTNWRRVTDRAIVS